MSKLIKNTGIYSIGRIFPQIAGFILLPIYTKYLGTNDYGIISSMAVLQVILSLIFVLSLDRAVIRLYWDYKTEAEKKVFFGTINIAITFFSVIILILLFAGHQFIGLIYKSISFYPFYAFTILAAFINVFSLVPKQYFVITEKPGAFITLSISQFILNAGSILWFLIVKNEGAEGYIKGVLFSGVTLLPVYVIIATKISTFKFNKAILKSALQYSLPLIPTLLTAWILNLSDRIFIEHYFNLSDVGIYSLGYKIAGLVLIFTGSFNMAYNPIFFKLANSENQKEAKKKLFIYNQTYLIIIVFVCYIVAFFSKEVIILFFDPKFKEAYHFIMLISFAYLFSSAGGLTSVFFQQSKKMKELMYLAFIITGVNIGLNFALIIPFGAYGAAYATIISMIIMFLIGYFYSRKKCYFIPIKWKLLISLLLIAIGIIYLFSLINLSTIYTLVLKSVTILILLLLVYHLYYDKIKLILKYNK